MKKAISFIIIFSCLFVSNVNATSGALRKDSIKTCSNGITYGNHSSNDEIHWHEAKKDNDVSSGWIAIGDPIYNDPCSDSNSSNSDGYEDTTFRLTYNAKGGKTSLTYVKVNENETVKVSSKQPSKSGYKFLGWDTESTAKNVVYKKGDIITMTEDITLYAVYGKKVKVSFDLNGGKSSKKYVYLYSNNTYSNLPTPTRTGYTFAGWYTSESSSGKLITDETKITKTKSHYIYAKWTVKTYTITYNLNGGTNSTKNKEKYTIKSSTFSLYSPTKKGYTFKGWYTSSKYKTKVTKVNKGSYGNKKLYAKWQENKYNIIYNGNGATSGSTKKQTGLSYSKAYTLRSNGFTRKGYKFVGWNTKKDGSGISYTNKESIKSLSSKSGGNVYLYAQWEIIEYTITYVNDGLYDNGYVNKTTYTVEDSVGFYSPNKRADGKPGYYFWGWYTDSSFKKSYYRIKKGTTGNIVLYGKWSVPKSPNELAIDHDATKEIILDKEDNDVTNDSYDILTTFGSGSGYYVSCVSSDTSIVKCETDGEWDDKTLTYTLTPVYKPGTTTVEIRSYSCVYSYKNGETYRNCTYYKRIPITVTVPDHWDEINFIVPQTLTDEDGIELSVTESKIIEQDSSYYTLKLSTILENATSSSSSSFTDGTLYFYDKYGNLLGEDTLYISGLKYSTVGQTFEYTYDYVPLATKKIIFGREYDTTGDLPYEYTEGPHLWEGVNVLTPNKIVDKDSFGKQMQLIDYSFFDEQPTKLSSIYKISALLKLVNYVDGDDKDFETTVYFYDKNGNELSNKKITLNNVKVDSLYKISLDVPNNTKTIAFDQDYYLTGEDITLNDAWHGLETEIQTVFEAEDKSDFSYLITNTEFVYMNKNYYGINVEYQITALPTSSYSATTFAYVKSFDAAGNRISCKYLQFEHGELNQKFSEVFPIKKGIKKIVIDTDKGSSCY